MSDLATNEIWSVFDARRVKAAELRGLDSMVSTVVGIVRNRLPVLARLRAQAERVDAMEPEIRNLSDARFGEEVERLREKTAQLEGTIGRQKVELDFFKNALRRVEELRRSKSSNGETASTRKSGDGCKRKAE